MGNYTPNLFMTQPVHLPLLETRYILLLNIVFDWIKIAGNQAWIFQVSIYLWIVICNFNELVLVDMENRTIK